MTSSYSANGSGEQRPRARLGGQFFILDFLVLPLSKFTKQDLTPKAPPATISGVSSGLGQSHQFFLSVRLVLAMSRPDTSGPFFFGIPILNAGGGFLLTSRKFNL
jgi:hypothetical protein